MATSGNNDPKAAVPEHERHLIHVEFENQQFNSRTGVKESVPRTQSFSVAEWKQVQESGIFDGYSVNIISQPSDYEGETGVQKAELHTGPLLGQEPEDKGPTGSVATTAGETLLQTTGSLEGDHVTTGDNVNSDARTDQQVLTPAPGTGEQQPQQAPATPQSPKQKLQAQYKEVIGEEAPADLTMVQLTEAINAKK